ncbi:MAG: hypothetical protein RI903_1209 [Bacteroidota bacterium]
MKNQLIFALGLLGFGLLTGCGSVQNAVVIQDDLYDTPVQASVPVKKKTKTNYLDFNDDSILIEEEDGLAELQVEPNYLNSRSVYANSYQSGYQAGLTQGIFSSNPWNSWYSNPYISYGTSFGARWYSPLTSWTMMDPYMLGMGAGLSYGMFGYSMSPFGMSSFGMSPYGYSSMMYGANPFYYDPFYRMGSMYNPYGFYGITNVYNYYGGLNSSYTTTNPYKSDPMPTIIRGPREERMSNRYGGENYTNTPRGNSNSYNVDGTNQPRVNSSNAPAYTAPTAAPSRRNSNYEYQSVPQQRNDSYSQPSYNYGNSSSGSSFGGSSSGGGGGATRGPR